jgi:hypothetical protein
VPPTVGNVEQLLIRVLAPRILPATDPATQVEIVHWVLADGTAQLVLTKSLPKLLKAPELHSALTYCPFTASTVEHGVITVLVPNVEAVPLLQVELTKVVADGLEQVATVVSLPTVYFEPALHKAVTYSLAAGALQAVITEFVPTTLKAPDTQAVEVKETPATERVQEVCSKSLPGKYIVPVSQAVETNDPSIKGLHMPIAELVPRVL